MEVDPFRSREDVDAYVRANGVVSLRALVRREQMRSSSQYWACAWLARHDEQLKFDLQQARLDLARQIASAPIV